MNYDEAMVGKVTLGSCAVFSIDNRYWANMEMSIYD